MSQAFRELLIWGLFLMLPMIAAIFVAQLCLTAPARRAERARLFLDLLETAIQSGQSPERAIISISETRDRIVSVHFHLLAAHIESGLSLSEALDRAPRLLPEGVREIVRIGATENAVPRLLPAARAMLVDTNSRMRGALNYVVLFLLVMAPAAIFFLPLLSLYVWPRLQQVMLDMEIPVPAFTVRVFEHFQAGTIFQAVFLVVMLTFAFIYVGGPRVHGWARIVFGTLPDYFLLLLPWRRRRAQRDFTGVLAVLLDANLPEERAVELASRATANALFTRRADQVIANLKNGASLPDALKAIEKDREFQWRWLNALRSGHGFFAALRGWHEALEARAFQQEQAAAHAVTSLVVVLNGIVVLFLTSAVFLIIISVIEEGVLW
jgi:type II secretory pathway component PulF